MQLDMRSELPIGTKEVSAMSTDEILNELATISFASENQPEPTISNSNRMEALRVILKYAYPVFEYNRKPYN